MSVFSTLSLDEINHLYTFFEGSYETFFDCIRSGEFDYAERVYPNSCLALERTFKIPFKDLPKHLSSKNMFVTPIVRYRLEVGK